MLTTRQVQHAYLPNIPVITPLDLSFAQRSPSLCSTASSSSGHSAVLPSSARSSYTSPGSARLPSFNDVQSEELHLRRKASRPLPSIPSTSTTPTSAGIGSTPCSASSATRTGLRPLPRPPLQERASTGSLPTSSLLEVPRSTAPVRPLPTPVPPSGSSPATPISPTTNSSITPSQAQCKAAKVQKPNRHPFPSLSLRIGAPGRSTTEIVLESPLGPISPLIFNRPLSLFPGTTEVPEGEVEDDIDHCEEEAFASEDAAKAHEAQVASRLSELGFVEMEDVRHSSYSDSSESSYGSRLSSDLPATIASTSRPGTSMSVFSKNPSTQSRPGTSMSVFSMDPSTQSRPGTSMSVFSADWKPPPRWDSHRPKHNAPSTIFKKKEKTTVARHDDEDTIRIELLSAPTSNAGKSRRASRASRVWVREKKGKRWVENDYVEVLNLLRKL